MMIACSNTLDTRIDIRHFSKLVYGRVNNVQNCFV
jgi:hypothetical protein